MATTLNERSFVPSSSKIKKQGHGRRSSLCALSCRAFTHSDERWDTKQEYNVAVQQRSITVRPIHSLRKDTDKWRPICCQDRGDLVWSIFGGLPGCNLYRERCRRTATVHALTARPFCSDGTVVKRSTFLSSLWYQVHTGHPNVGVLNHSNGKARKHVDFADSPSDGPGSLVESSRSLHLLQSAGRSLGLGLCRFPTALFQDVGYLAKFPKILSGAAVDELQQYAVSCYNVVLDPMVKSLTRRSNFRDATDP